MSGCHNEFASYAHGTKGTAIISTSATPRARSASSRTRPWNQENPVWAFPQPEPSPYQLEWDDLIDGHPQRQALQRSRTRRHRQPGDVHGPHGRPYRARSSPTSRCSNCEHEFAPDVDKLTMNSPAPLKADADGKYPCPSRASRRSASIEREETPVFLSPTLFPQWGRRCPIGRMRGNLRRSASSIGTVADTSALGALELLAFAAMTRTFTVSRPDPDRSARRWDSIHRGHAVEGHGGPRPGFLPDSATALMLSSQFAATTGPPPTA